MMNRLLVSLSVLTLAVLLVPTAARAHPHIISVPEKIEVTPLEMVRDLRQARVIFIGEFHDHPGHHRAQLSVIDALDDGPQPLAIGLEMFRRDSQEILDRWTANDLPLHEFLVDFNDNWGMWPVYRDIFMHARANRLQMVGLNIPRHLTGQVARDGFQSLSEEQRRMLGDVECIVDPAYGRFIRRAMGGHDDHGSSFLHFCEAQLLWDTIMARNLVDFLDENPDYRVVVLAGNGHAWKYGIPRQMLEEADIEYRVILPEIPGRADRHDIAEEIADYLWLDVGADGWSF